MKKVLIAVFFAAVLNADVLSVITQIKQMEKFKPKFKKIPSYNIFTKNMEVNKSVVKSGAVQNSTLKLNAVFQNSANINGIWLKTGDDILGYKVVKISDNYVILQKDGIYKKITINSKILKVGK